MSVEETPTTARRGQTSGGDANAVIDVFTGKQHSQQSNRVRADRHRELQGCPMDRYGISSRQPPPCAHAPPPTPGRPRNLGWGSKVLEKERAALTKVIGGVQVSRQYWQTASASEGSGGQAVGWSPVGLQKAFIHSEQRIDTWRASRGKRRQSGGLPW